MNTSNYLMGRTRQCSTPGDIHPGVLWGLTLIELLVVIAIISILACLLWPSLSGAKRDVYNAQCKNNQYQLGVALYIYLFDYGVYPIGTLGGGIGTWQQLLITNASSNCFYCPQSINARSNYVQLIGSSTSDVLPHYGYNADGAVWFETNPPPNLGLGIFIPGGLQSSYKALKEEAVKAPSDMIALGDTGGYVKPPLAKQIDGSTLFYIALPFKIQVPGEKDTIGTDIVGDWHDGGANMLFCDSHVEYKKQSVWTATNDAARCRWNNDHQPHPEFWGGR